MSYYFLVSSLPGISLNTAPPLSLTDFRERCADKLSVGDQAALNAVLSFSPPPSNAHPFAERWIARETQLRNAAARLRAAQRQEDAGDYVQNHPGFDVALEDAVDQAFNQPNPMERERALDQLRWTILDELAGVDPFAAPIVLAYGKQLSLAERWAAMNAETGKIKLDAAINQSTEPDKTLKATS